MSEEIVDHKNNKSTKSYFKGGPSESCNKLLLENTSSSKNLISIHNLNFSNTKEKDKLKTSIMLTNTVDTFTNKLVETNNFSFDSLPIEDHEYLVTMLNKKDLDTADLNSHDENKIVKIIKQNIKHIYPLTSDEMEINTQKFMDLFRVHQQTRQSLNVPKKQNFDIMDSDVTTSPKSCELMNTEHNNENFLTVNGPVTYNNTVSTVDLELPYQDEDPEIITFQAMCEDMLKIRAIGNNVTCDDDSTYIVNNQAKHLIFKPMNENIICCVNDVDCVPSTSILNSAVNSNYMKDNDDILNRPTSKRCHRRLISNSSDEKLNDLSQKLYNCKDKIAKFTSSPKTLNLNSKLHAKNTENQFKDSKKINTYLISSEGEEDNNNQLSKIKRFNSKRVGDDSSEQNKRFKKCEPIFCCSPGGIIHEDMLNYIDKKKSIIKL